MTAGHGTGKGVADAAGKGLHMKEVGAGAPAEREGGDGRPHPPPMERPPFTIGDIRKELPARLFERDALRSLSHVVLDLALVAACFVVAVFGITRLPWAAQLVAWPVYWYVQGSYMTGLWVLAHECGHEAFSASRLINDTVGCILHSALLVPYWSWKYSHAAHHMNTCSVENDEVFVPATRSSLMGEMINDTPLANAIGIFLTLTVGWPGYLLGNAGGPAKYAKAAHNSHFHPMSALFTDRQRLWVAMSDVGFFAMVAVLVWASFTFGATNVLFYYFLPYLVVNAHLVTITLLQHSDTYIPHYREAEFDWLRGALSTVDRSFGAWLDTTLHHIADTHVVHHLFSHMPWYHAQEATKIVQAKLGPYYLRDDTPILRALWRSWRECRFIEDEGAILYYKGVADAAVPPSAPDKKTK